MLPPMDRHQWKKILSLFLAKNRFSLSLLPLPPPSPCSLPLCVCMCTCVWRLHILLLVPVMCGIERVWEGGNGGCGRCQWGWSSHSRWDADIQVYTWVLFTSCNLQQKQIFLMMQSSCLFFQKLLYKLVNTCTVQYGHTLSYRLTGYVSRCTHGCGRSTTDRQFYYCNGRPIELPRVRELLI